MSVSVLILAAALPVFDWATNSIAQRIAGVDPAVCLSRFDDYPPSKGKLGFPRCLWEKPFPANEKFWLKDVGYQNIEGGANKKFIQGCQFMNVSSTPVDIQTIIYKENGEIPNVGCDLWWWNNNLPGGDMGFEYAYWNNWWYDPEDESLAADDYYGDGPCWTDDNEEEPHLIKKTFAPGDGFYVQPNGAAVNPKLFFPNPFAKK